MNSQNLSEQGRSVARAEGLVVSDAGYATSPVTIPYRANLLGNIEQALKGLQGYGIMALELIQNADDASAKVLSFDARDDALVVDNDGEFSSCGLLESECPWLRGGDAAERKRPCNFHAISEMGSRSKLGESEQIGRFGIGFVSVYQITDTPIVQSVGVEIRLNPQTQEVVKRDIERTGGTRFVLPWASVDSEVRNGLNASPTPVDVADKVVAEIDYVLLGSLLFLRHVERVELRRNGRLIVCVDIDRAGEEITLGYTPTGTKQRWLVLSKSADDVIAEAKLLERFETLGRLSRSMTVNVAVPLDIEQLDGLLYAYLPTRQPTGMPVHVNADFFPHASRQAIVLDGEQHERYWNEALIDTAAAMLAENFAKVRDLLGPTRLWALGAAAFQCRTEPAFKPFWDRLGAVAAEAPSIWTTQGAWAVPNDTALAPEAMLTADQAAVTDLGIALIHPELRRYWTVLSSIGAQQLRLSTLVTALEARGADATAGGGEPLRRLWSAVALMIDASSERTGLPSVLAKLEGIPFILDVHDRPLSPEDARRLPSSVPQLALHRTLPDRRVVHPDVLALPQLADLVPEYLLDDIAEDIAGVVTDDAAADIVIGSADIDVKRFYALLTAFPTDRGAARAGDILSDVPMLRAGNSFVSPRRGQLPGDFRDPVGHFEIIDTGSFVTGMRDFAQHVLHVPVLTFREYVESHLATILEAGVTREQYGALLSEIVNHRSQLYEDGTLAKLAGMAFVRTRDGAFALPAECYFWSASLSTILGDDPARWVDETWFPAAVLPRARDLFEGRLGMPFTVAAEHIVERIALIAETGTSEGIVAGTAPIIRHVLERWSRFEDADREVLRALKDVKFLAAIVEGEREEGTLYSPREVYRAGRAAGFSSQVAIVEMTALRQANAIVIDFLDLIEMPAEPSTSQVVAHLEHCMSSGTAVNDLTYQMLSERLDRGDDAAAIDRLTGTDFIHVPDVGFIGADDVFWVPPLFGAYWHSASQRMRQREQLYRRLGVVDSPEPRHFAALALRIAANESLTDNDVAIHARCLTALAEAFERGDAGAADAVDLLTDDYAFLNLEHEATWTGEAVWLDSEPLADAFGSVLDDRLVRLSDVSRGAAVRFLGRLEVPALTDVARFRLAEEPDGHLAEEATQLLRDRSDLILWLAPNRPTRLALRDILTQLEIRYSERLMVQAEIEAFDPPVRSPASSASAYLDSDGALLHLRETPSGPDWAAVFRALFAEVERFCPTADVPPLCLTAAYIMLQPDRGGAEQTLRASGFKEPGADDGGIDVGRELDDAPDDDPFAVGEAECAESDRGARGDEDAAADENVGDSEFVGAAEEDLPSAVGSEHEDYSRGGGAADGETGFGADGEAADTGDGREDVDAGGSSHCHSGEAAATDYAGADRDAATEEGASEDGFSGEAYGSAPSRGAFGADPAEPGSAGETGDRGGETGSGPSRRRTSPFRSGYSGSESSAERQARRSRMLSYVSRNSQRGESEASAALGGEDLAGLIDAAAMKAAMSYEEGRGWDPERQPHFNPGFDIASKSSDGSRRLIEVKGLEDEWTERGVKLSHVQFAMAREHPDEFWIYVVEYARDLDRQRVIAIANPFGKVEEYWFDHNWRDLSEERASSRDIHLKVGLRVEHHLWGKGMVVEIKSRGLIPFVVVDFGQVEGRRGIPFNSSLKIVD